MTDDERAAAIRIVADAFAGVTLGAGVGLRQGQGLDDYAGERACAQMRESDEKTNWSRLPIDELNLCNSSLMLSDNYAFAFASLGRDT